ncbi:hypothetical protein MMC21_006670 [Puttea exsequens]|nr:hypothetical protein [Puttea exsequens]
MFLLLLLFALVLWWFNGGSQEVDVVKLNASGLGKELLQERRMHDYQFYPATNPKIHYIGRWTSTPNRLRKDGTFPGVYFDVIIQNTTSLLLALHNAPQPNFVASPTARLEPISTTAPPGHRHFRFHAASANEKPALPISLLAQVDDEEYILLPNSSSLVSISSNSLDLSKQHRVRIIAPMTDNLGQGVVELDGLWLSKGGKLLKVPGSMLSEDYLDEDLLKAENDQVGKKHRTGLHQIEKDGNTKHDQHTISEEMEERLAEASNRKRILEVISDSPGSFPERQRGRRTGGADGLLSGVMGWDYLLGEMFGADHVTIGADGMCLIPECIGGTGQPAGLGDVFFRSGPSDSPYFDHPWMFSGYIPDVMVLHIGSSDDASFHTYKAEYNITLWQLSEKFEATYVSLVKAIRNLAYPKHPSLIQSERSGSSGIISSNAPASIPIFIMRPFRGQLEQATQSAVAKLRLDGDKAVFWLDTSGWLDPDVESADYPDFFLDESMTPPRWRLTEQGNQRAAIFLHTHVCRYLAADEGKCAFLPHEVYQGKVWDPEEAKFDKYIEDEKERKLKKIFWENEGPLISNEAVDGLI